jgi:uncharacterized protein YndB with AHSA1/START domain
MMIEGQGDAGLVVHLATGFRAPRDKIWRTWTEPSLLSKWFMAAPGYLPAEAEVNLEELGSWKITVRHSNTPDDPSVLEGNFHRIIPNELLAYTWAGNVNGGQYPTLVNVRFEDAGKGSRIVLTQGIFETESHRIDPERGWEVCIGCLHRFLETEG